MRRRKRLRAALTRLAGEIGIMIPDVEERKTVVPRGGLKAGFRGFRDVRPDR
jgi:hypothetical protein